MRFVRESLLGVAGLPVLVIRENSHIERTRKRDGFSSGSPLWCSPVNERPTVIDIEQTLIPLILGFTFGGSVVVFRRIMWYNYTTTVRVSLLLYLQSLPVFSRRLQDFLPRVDEIDGSVGTLGKGGEVKGREGRRKKGRKKGKKEGT